MPAVADYRCKHKPTRGLAASKASHQCFTMTLACDTAA